MIYIDRIEDGVAVLELEDGAFARAPLRDLPDGAREGSALTVENGVYTFCASEEAARRKKLAAMQARLFRPRGTE